jgi:hypothetical protein
MLSKNEEGGQSYLRINAKTWGRDSHGLFDYESNQIKVNTLCIDGSCKVVRKRNDVKQISDEVAIDLEDRELCKVGTDGGKLWFLILGNSYSLHNAITFRMDPAEDNISELQNKIWYVIRPEDANPGSSGNTNNMVSQSINDTYDIKINDIIKLGRVKYVITEIKLEDKLLTLEKDVTNPVFNLIGSYKYIQISRSSKNINLGTDIICKVCLSNCDDETNPMFSNICRCIGSISCIHFQCLKYWMQTKLSIKENEKKTVTSYNMKSFNCELCKFPYPRNDILLIFSKV